MRVDELGGGVTRADLLGGLHGRKIEEHRDQPPVLQLVGLEGRICRRGFGGRGWFGLHRSARLERGRRHFERRQCRSVQVLQLEHRDLLRLAVFEQCELVLLQIFDRFTALVFYRDVDDDQVGAGPEGGRLLLLRQQSRASEHRGKNSQGASGHGGHLPKNGT